MAERLVYDEPLMDEIAQGFADAAAVAASMDTELQAIYDNYDVNYAGNGKVVAQETVEKLKEHISLLHMCLENAGEYVTFSKEHMMETDRSLGGGGGGSR